MKLKMQTNVPTQCREGFMSQYHQWPLRIGINWLVGCRVWVWADVIPEAAQGLPQAGEPKWKPTGMLRGAYLGEGESS